MNQQRYLKNADLTSPEEMHTVIEALEILKIKLTGWMISHKTRFIRENKTYLADMFDRQLIQLRKAEVLILKIVWDLYG